MKILFVIAIIAVIIGISAIGYGLYSYNQATRPFASQSFESNDGFTANYFGPSSLKNVTCYLEITPKANTLDNFTLRVHFGGDFVANTTYGFQISVTPFSGNMSMFTFKPTTNTNITQDVSFQLGNLPISEADGVKSIHLAFNHIQPEIVTYVTTFYLNANDTVTSSYPNIGRIIFTASTQEIDFGPITNVGSLILSYSDFNAVTQYQNGVNLGLHIFGIGITLTLAAIPAIYHYGWNVEKKEPKSV